MKARLVECGEGDAKFVNLEIQTDGEHFGLDGGVMGVEFRVYKPKEDFITSLERACYEWRYREATLDRQLRDMNQKDS
jgi:hypothetical protein